MDDSTAPSNLSLDLDALAPKSATINYKGNAIEVQPLSLDVYSKLLDMASELSQVKDNTAPKDIMPIYARLKGVIDEIIPELKDVNLNITQMIGIFNLLIDANSPKDKTLSELAARGIELKKEDENDPKALTSSDQSVSSSEPTPPTE